MTNDRIEKAVGLFKSGYNCSQSVVAAFADMYGFTEEQALRMSASFGGGIGRMRQTFDLAGHNITPNCVYYGFILYSICATMS